MNIFLIGIGYDKGESIPIVTIGKSTLFNALLGDLNVLLSNNKWWFDNFYNLVEDRCINKVEKFTTYKLLGEEVEYFVESFEKWNLPIWTEQFKDNDRELSIDFYAMNLKEYLLFKTDKVFAKLTGREYLYNMDNVYHILELALDEDSSKELKDIMFEKDKDSK